jgi:hypothetical protein
MGQAGLSGQSLFEKQIPVQPDVSAPKTTDQFIWRAKECRHRLPRRFNLLDHSPCVAVHIPGVSMIFEQIIPVNTGLIISMLFSRAVVMVGVVLRVLRFNTGDLITCGIQVVMVMNMRKGVVHHHENKDEQHQQCLYSVANMHRESILGNINHISNQTCSFAIATPFPALC